MQAQACVRQAAVSQLASLAGAQASKAACCCTSWYSVARTNDVYVDLGSRIGKYRKLLEELLRERAKAASVTDATVLTAI